MERPQKPRKPQSNQSPQNMRNIQEYQRQQQMYQMQNQQQNGMSAEEKAYQMIAEKRKKRNKRIIITLCIILALVLGSVGVYYIATGRISSRVTGLEAQVASLEEQIVMMTQDHAAEVAKLEEEIADTTVKELIPETSLQRVEGSNVPELWLMEGDFIAPNPLIIPDTVDGVSDNYVQIGSRFVFRPSDQWIMSSRGAIYEFGHPEKIWGKIKALTVKELVPEAQMKQLISDFFVGYPATSVIYRDIFLDERVVGKMGKAEITVKYEDKTINTTQGSENQGSENQSSENQSTQSSQSAQTTPVMIEKKMIVNVGFCERGDYGLSFLFIYDAEGGSNSQELVDSLIRSCSLGPQGSLLKLGPFGGV